MPNIRKFLKDYLTDGNFHNLKHMKEMRARKKEVGHVGFWEYYLDIDPEPVVYDLQLLASDFIKAVGLIYFPPVFIIPAITADCFFEGIRRLQEYKENEKTDRTLYTKYRDKILFPYRWVIRNTFVKYTVDHAAEHDPDFSKELKKRKNKNLW
jgi:hypothetical protein